MANGDGIMSSLDQVIRFQGRKPIPRERGRALESIVADLEKYRQEFSEILAGHGEIEIKSSSAGNAICPWVSICTNKFNLDSDDGYFVDLLFSRNKKVYLVIIPKVRGLEDEEIVEKKNMARSALAGKVPSRLERNADRICLCAQGGVYPAKYELGIAVAQEIKLGGTTEKKLINRICRWLRWLNEVYDAIKKKKAADDGIAS